MKAQPFLKAACCSSGEVASPSRDAGENLLLRPRRASRFGFALLESSVAMGIVAMFLAGVFTTNSRVLGLLNSTKDSGEAQQAVRDRIEKIRSATWENLTSPEYIQDTVLSSNVNVFPHLRGATITVSVTAFPPDKTPAASPLLVERGPSGTVTIKRSGDGTMTSEDAVRLEVTAQWKSPGGATRTRQAFTVIGKNGIAGRKR